MALHVVADDYLVIGAVHVSPGFSVPIETLAQKLASFLDSERLLLELFACSSPRSQLRVDECAN